MKIISWNIRHGGGKQVQKIITALLAQSPDIVVLTEFRGNEGGIYIQRALKNAGLVYQQAGIGAPKRNTVFIASRELAGFKTLDEDFEHSKQRWLVAQFHNFDLYAAYFPQKEFKREHFERFAVEQKALAGRNRSAMLIGDLNTGRHQIDEEGKTFHCVDAFEALMADGWQDAWRAEHGADAREYTWFSPQGNGFRIDHCLVSGGLVGNVKSVRYDHGVRESNISDHSMMIVELG